MKNLLSFILILFTTNLNAQILAVEVSKGNKKNKVTYFYDLLITENPKFPVIAGDIPDTWINGCLSMPRETKMSKHLQRETHNTEILNTQFELGHLTTQYT